MPLDKFKEYKMLNDIIINLPDGRAENNLAQYLKSFSEKEREKVIICLLEHDSDYVRASMLKIVPRVVMEKDLLFKILDMGLEKKNISGVKLWFKATAGGLGYKKILNHMKVIAKDHPDWIAYAWYHLVPLVLKEAPDCVSILDDIKNITEANICGDLKSFWERNKEAVLY